MPKKKKGTIKIAPIKPKEAESRIIKNGFKLLYQEGAHAYYIKIKNGKKVLDEEGKEIMAMISFHPKELRKPFVKQIIKRAKKTNKEWINL